MADSNNLSCPIEHSYWVVPGQLLAGEYPRTLDRVGSIAKLESLLNAGVSTFIDLTTDADGLAPYEEFLPEASGSKAIRHSFPIPDVRIPESDRLTHAALELIDTRLAAGEPEYVHCWGGIGRTGTIVGCWLARHGYHGDAALSRLAELWSSCPKSQRRDSPDTEAQRNYIREWQAFSATASVHGRSD